MILTLISFLTLAVIRYRALRGHISGGDVKARGIVLTFVVLTLIYVKLNEKDCLLYSNNHYNKYLTIFTSVTNLAVADILSSVFRAGAVIKTRR